MSVRKFGFEVDGIPIMIQTADGEKPAVGASMTWIQAEQHVEQGKELLANKQDVSDVEWLNRTLRVVSESLQRAGMKIEASELKEQFDIPTLNGMSDQVLFMSGLKSAKDGAAGGAKAVAVTTLQNSAAA